MDILINFYADPKDDSQIHVFTSIQPIDSNKIPLYRVAINITLSRTSVQRLFSIALKLRRVGVARFVLPSQFTSLVLY
jgi:hypothetical protein